MIIDFRLRPPFGGFLNVGMYADKAAADFYAASIGMVRSESARRESMSLLLREMEENGIDMGVATGRMGHQKGHVPNDDIIRLMESYPGTFVGLAGLDASDCRAAVDELRRVVLNGPLKGVVLEPGAMAQPRRVDDRRLYPLYAECEQYSVPVVLMIGGRAGPDRSYSHPRALSRVAADFPGVDFVAAHGCWPFVQEVLGVCFYQPNIYLCPDLYFFNLPGQDDYIRAGNGYLQDRLLFGSAYPFTPLACVHDFRSAFRPEVRAKLLGANAARLLRLNASSPAEPPPALRG